VFKIFLVILFLAVGIVFLYNYRPKSADARVLIWRVSCDMIMDRPLSGHGAGAFDEKYMLYQAAFFEKNPKSPFVLVAGNAGYPFNELLNTVICFGVIGIVLLLFLLWTVFRNLNSSDDLKFKSKIFKAGLSSWLAFALFSYPTEVFPLLLLAITCLGGIKSEVKLSFRPSRWFYGVIILFLAVVSFQVWRDTIELKRLSGKLKDLYENTSRSMDGIEHSYNKMKFNSTFNNYYMAWLENQPVERYTAKVKDVLPSCEGYCMKGKYYLEIGETEQAQQAFYTASKHGSHTHTTQLFPLETLSRKRRHGGGQKNGSNDTELSAENGKRLYVESKERGKEDVGIHRIN